VIEEESRERSEIDRAKKKKDDLYSANALAATWFEEQLRKHPLRSFALDELGRRGIVPGEKPLVDEALKAFRIGYAPLEWDGLATFFRQQGISPNEAETVGLLSPRTSGSGHYDRFRHRLMFAVLDTQGRVVAFSGRALAEPPGAQPKPDGEKPAKYVNSKESPIYTKGNVLFGLFQARHAIRTEEIALVVEGNFDVFSLHARGLSNVVAPLGTAFTVEQARLLKRYTPRVVLLFDGDAAGRKATFAARGPCKQEGLIAQVGLLPDGQDPDDFARVRGIEALKTCVKEPKGLLVFMIDAELDESFGAVDLHEKLARIERIADLIASEDDPLVRLEASTHADSVVAGRLDILGAESLRALHAKLRAKVRALPVVPRLGGVGGSGRAPPDRARSTPKTAASIERRDMVGALLDYPSLLADPDVVAACVHLEGPAALTIAVLRKAYTGEKGLDTGGFLAQIPPAIRFFASNRLAVPEHESEGQAKEALLASAERLERLILAQDIVDISRDLEKDADLEKLRNAQSLAERKSGLGTKRTIQGFNARPARTSGLGATPHEERPFEEARDEGGGDGGTRRASQEGLARQAPERTFERSEEPPERSPGAHEQQWLGSDEDGESARSADRSTPEERDPDEY
jgi:DNA primase